LRYDAATMTATADAMSPREQVIELVSRYFAAVDDKRLDLGVAEATFAADGKIVRPNGAELVGFPAIVEGQSESFARFGVTQHVITDHVVDFEVDGDIERARVRANVVATHLWAPGQGDPVALESHFTAGGVLGVEALRLNGAWRIASLSNRVVWRTGSGFAQMLRTGQR
jgi:SnoaL-like domain